MLNTGKKWVAGAVLGMVSVSGLLVATHQYIEPLDSSTEMFASALGVSGLLYLLGFVALGYGIFNLNKTNNLNKANPSRRRQVEPHVRQYEDKVSQVYPLNIAEMIADYCAKEKHILETLNIRLGGLIGELSQGRGTSHLYGQLCAARSSLTAFIADAPVNVEEMFFDATGSESWSDSQKLWHMFFGKHNYRGLGNFRDPSTKLTFLEYIERYTHPKVRELISCITELEAHLTPVPAPSHAPGLTANS